MDVIARDGGSLYLEDAVDVTLNGVAITNGKAIGGDGGAIHATLSNPLSPVAGILKF